MTQIGEITVTVKPEAKDFRRVLVWYQRRRMVTMVLIVSTILIALGLFLTFRVPTSSSTNIGLPLILTAVTMPFFFGILFFIGIKKQAKKLEAISHRTTVTFDADGIRTVSDSSETSVAWSRFDKIVETSDDFVVFPQENVFYPVPKRFFEEPSKVESLRALLCEALGERSKVKM